MIANAWNETPAQGISISYYQNGELTDRSVSTNYMIAGDGNGNGYVIADLGSTQVKFQFGTGKADRVSFGPNSPQYNNGQIIYLINAIASVDGTVSYDYLSEIFNNPNKLCGFYEFKRVGNGWPGEIVGLGIIALHMPSKQTVSANWGAWCVTLAAKGLTTETASQLFKSSWNLMTDELQAWMNSRGEYVPSSIELGATAISIFEQNVTELSQGFGQVSTGPCSGNIPTSVARYDCLFDLSP